MNIFVLKALHLAAVFALFTSLGAILFAGHGKKSATILHGVSLLLILLVGFAILKKPPMDQHWWQVKLALWLFIGAAPAIAKRQLLCSTTVMTLCIAAASCAGYLAMAKPF